MDFMALGWKDIGVEAHCDPIQIGVKGHLGVWGQWPQMIKICIIVIVSTYYDGFHGTWTKGNWDRGTHVTSTTWTQWLVTSFGKDYCTHLVIVSLPCSMKHLWAVNDFDRSFIGLITIYKWIYLTHQLTYSCKLHLSRPDSLCDYEACQTSARIK